MEVQTRSDYAELKWNDPTAPICRSPNGDAFMRSISTTDETLCLLMDLTNLSSPPQAQHAERAESLANAQENTEVGKRSFMQAPVDRTENALTQLLEKNFTRLSVGAEVDVRFVKALPSPASVCALPDPVQLSDTPNNEGKISWAKVASLSTDKNNGRTESLTESQHSLSESETILTSITTAQDNRSTISPPSSPVSVSDHTATVRFSDNLCHYFPCDNGDINVRSSKRTARHRRFTICSKPSSPSPTRSALSSRSSFSSLQDPDTKLRPSAQEHSPAADMLSSVIPVPTAAHQMPRRELASPLNKGSQSDKPSNARSLRTLKATPQVKQTASAATLPLAWIKAGNESIQRSEFGQISIDANKHDVKSTTSPPHIKSEISQAKSPTPKFPRLPLKIRKSHDIISPPKIAPKMTQATLKRLSQPKHITPKAVHSGPGLCVSTAESDVGKAKPEGETGQESNNAPNLDNDAGDPRAESEGSLSFSDTASVLTPDDALHEGPQPCSAENGPSADAEAERSSDGSFTAQFNMLEELLPEKGSNYTSTASDSPDVHGAYDRLSRAGAKVTYPKKISIEELVKSTCKEPEIKDGSTFTPDLNVPAVDSVSPTSINDPAIVYCASPVPVRKTSDNAASVSLDAMFEKAKRDFETRSGVYGTAHSITSAQTRSTVDSNESASAKASTLRPEAIEFRPRIPTEWTDAESSNSHSVSTSEGPWSPRKAKLHKKNKRNKGKHAPNGYTVSSPPRALYQTILNTTVGVDDQNRPVADTQYYFRTTPDNFGKGYQTGTYRSAAYQYHQQQEQPPPPPPPPPHHEFAHAFNGYPFQASMNAIAQGGYHTPSYMSYPSTAPGMLFDDLRYAETPAGAIPTNNISAGASAGSSVSGPTTEYASHPTEMIREETEPFAGEGQWAAQMKMSESAGNAYLGFGIAARRCGVYDVTSAVEQIGSECGGCAQAAPVATTEQGQGQ